MERQIVAVTMSNANKKKQGSINGMHPHQKLLNFFRYNCLTMTVHVQINDQCRLTSTEIKHSYYSIILLEIKCILC